MVSLAGVWAGKDVDPILAEPADFKAVCCNENVIVNASRGSRVISGWAAHLGKFTNNSGGIVVMLLELRYKLLMDESKPKLRGIDIKTLFRTDRFCSVCT